MEPGEVLEIASSAIFVALKIAGPIMVIALLVGLTISLLQALTQIQEMTLAFVPKIVIIFLSVIMFLPFMLSELTNLAEELSARIVALG